MLRSFIKISAPPTFCIIGAVFGCSTRADPDCESATSRCAPDALDASPDASPDAADPADPGRVIPEPEDDARYIFDQGVVRTYNLVVAEADLAIIDANPSAEQTVPGMLEFEGNQYGPLGVRYKGSVGAFNPPCMAGPGGRGPKTGKCSVKVSFDHVDEEARFYGLKKLNFHAMNRDGSLLRDRLGYSLFREMGIAAPRAVHARLFFNGKLEGLFALVEQIDGRFTRSRFSEGGGGNLYKEVWPVHDTAGPYLNALETNRQENPSVEGALAFKRAIDEGADATLGWLDRDYILRYIAVDRVSINDDGAFNFRCFFGGDGGTSAGVNHNFYWYEAAHAQRFWLVPWDLDNNFDNRATVHIASEWTATGSCTCAGFGQLAPACDPLIHHWGSWRADYDRIVDEFLQTAFSPSNVDPRLAAWISQIEAAVDESAGLKGAPTAAFWRNAVEQLRGKIATARTHRGYPYSVGAPSDKSSMVSSGDMTTRLPSFKSDKVAIDVEAASRQERVSVDLSARFQVRDLLGQGGMGSVFVAHDRGLGRIVALKRLRDDYAKDRSAMRRFVLEAQIGAQLEHPNIVPLYSFEQSESGSPVITMQLLEGTTMDEYFDLAARAPAAARAVHGEYSLKERIGTLLGVGEAIHFAHEHGVVHRDLKPANVMLGRHREVYVMDWGIARVLGSPIDMARERQAADGGNGSAKAAPSAEEDAPTIASVDAALAMATRQGEVMGTAQYMPREQALGQIDRVGPAADQYAIGVMLQELATLRPARSHTDLMAALTLAVQSKLEEPVDLAGKPLHPALLAIIQRATRAEPEARYPSVRAMTEDLRRFIRDEPVSVYREGVARKLVREAARRPALAFAILSLLVFIASVAVVGGVIHDARKTERQARQLENTRRVLIAVSDRAHLVDVELSDLAANVKAVGAATIELLERGGAEFDRKPPVLPPLVPSEAYGGAAESFDSIVIAWPGKAPGAQLPLPAAKLVHVDRWLRACVVDALPPNDRHGSPSAQAAALVAGRSALLRGFVGLSDGSFIQYPAREVPPEHDPRKRPWYTMASRDNELHWTRPVVDVARKTLRISALLGLRSREQFLGVAGCDLRVSSFARKLRIDLPGFQQAYLVTEDGKIAVSETLETTILAKVTNPDEELELPPVDDAELSRRIAGSERGGYVESGDRLLVFSKLVSPKWTYVAELERGLYIER